MDIYGRGYCAGLLVAAAALFFASYCAEAQNASGQVTETAKIGARDSVPATLPLNHADGPAPAYPMWPELRALLADPNGLNSPNTGFAYEVPPPAGTVAAQ